MYIIKKNYLLILILLSLYLSANLWASYVEFMPITLTQPDGTEIKCFVSGDENHNWIHDKNNFTIIKHPVTGYYVFADKKGNEIIPTDYIVGQADPLSAGLISGVDIDQKSIKEKYKRNSYFITETDNSEAKIQFLPTEGSINSLVVFVRFTDENEYTDLFDTYENLFNNKSEDAVSVNNYYRKVSYGKVDLNFTLYPEPENNLVVSYQDIHPRGYYQRYSEVNNIGYHEEESHIRTQELVRNAAEYCSHIVPADLNIDANNDNLVDNFILIVKGDAEGWADILWPHMSLLTSYKVKINGKTVSSYNLQLSEWTKRSLGVLCHEMGHSFGAPDLYHYDDDGIIPVGPWDIMGNSSYMPPHMSSYMKSKYFHWVDEIPEITEPGTYSLKPLTETDGNCYKIKSPLNYREYFFIEYRKADDMFESSLPGEGLLVYRIFTANYGNSQAGNSNIYNEIYLYRPDGTRYNNGNIYNANFSGNSGRNKINDSTNPTSFMGDGKAGGLNIYNISVINDEITFDVSFDPAIEVEPKIVFPTDYSNNSFNKDLLMPGQEKEIKWMGFKNERINIEFSSDAGNTWSNIAQEIQADQKFYNWTVPDLESSECLIKIYSAYNQARSAITEKFTVNKLFRRGYDEYNPRAIRGIYFWDELTGVITSGSNILKTTDGGKTFEFLYSASFELTNIFFIDNNNGWACGVNGITLRTTNGGESWEEVFVQDAIQLNDIIFQDSMTGFSAGVDFFNVGETGTFLYKTINGGKDWNRIKVTSSNFDLWDIALFGKNNIYLPAENRAYFSEDGGNSWQSINPSGNNIQYVEFYNDLIGWGTGSNIYKTSDGGKTWEMQFSNNGLLKNILIIDKNKVFVFGRIGKIYKTEDGGENWETINLGINNSFLKSVYTDGYIYASGDVGLILKSSFLESNAVELNDNWNLLSYNKGQKNYTVSEFFGEIYDNVEAVISFDQEALIHIPGESMYNNFNSVDAFHGYWVKMSNQNKITLEDGFIDPYIPIPLNKGWNLVGYLPSSSNSILNALSSISENIIAVLGYDKEGLTYDPDVPEELNTLRILEPNKGYWIKLADNDTLIYTLSQFPSMDMQKNFDLEVDNTVGRNVIATTEWMNIYCKNFSIDNQLLKAGTVIQAVDPDGVICGEYKVKIDGELGLMPIYKDSPYTKDIDEGADPDDKVFLKINGKKSAISFEWTELGESLNLDKTITDISNVQQVPEEFNISQNYPNPFNPVTNIKYQLPFEGAVSIKIFDIQGQEIAELLREEQKPGYYVVEWNAEKYASGVYFLKIQFNDLIKIRKMMLLK